MRLSWTVLPLIVIGIVGISESFAEEEISVHVDGGKLLNFIPIDDLGFMNIEIDMQNDGSVTLDLPKNIWHLADSECNSISPTILIDGQNAVFTEDFKKNKRVITISTVKNSERIELLVSGPAAPHTTSLMYGQFCFMQEQGIFPSPKKQMELGFMFYDVQCRYTLIKMFKPSNNFPVCVKSETKTKLIERGWSTVENDSKSFLPSFSMGPIFITSLSISNVPTLGQTAEVTVHGQYHAANVWPKDAQADVSVVIGIPEGFEIVNGTDLSLVEEFDYLGSDYKRFSKNFTGSLSNPFVLSVTVRAVQTGNWTIGGSVLNGADYLYISIGEHGSYINNEQFPLPPRKSGY